MLCRWGLLLSAAVVLACSLDTESAAERDGGAAASSGFGGSAASSGASGAAAGGAGGELASGGSPGAGGSGEAGSSGGGAGSPGQGGTAGSGQGGTAGSGPVDPCADKPNAVALVISGSTHCYWLGDSSTNQGDAQAGCQNQGGYLATILSQEENEAVTRITAASFPLWVGMSRPTTSGGCTKEDYRWMTGEPAFFDAWDGSEPDCSGSGVVMIAGGRWRDRYVETKYRYACESGPPVTRPDP
jgi:hypothetical protein